MPAEFTDKVPGMILLGVYGDALGGETHPEAGQLLPAFTPGLESVPPPPPEPPIPLEPFDPLLRLKMIAAAIAYTGGDIKAALRLLAGVSGRCRHNAQLPGTAGRRLGRAERDREAQLPQERGPDAAEPGGDLRGAHGRVHGTITAVTRPEAPIVARASCL